MRDKIVQICAKVTSWAVLDFARCRHDDIERFIRTLTRVGAEQGMVFKETKPPLIAGRPLDIQKCCEEAFSDATKVCGNESQFVLIILPSKDTYTYAEIKRVTDTIIGKPSQCMQASHLAKAQAQYCANLCLKINLKLGGTNWSLGLTQLKFIADEPTVVIGADVTHAGQGSVRPTICAVVASLDRLTSRYVSAVRLQPAGSDVIKDMQDIMYSHFIAFAKANEMFPKRILIFRDGVSEGQFAVIRKYELRDVKAAVDQVRASGGPNAQTWSPTITMVLVQKRHHTRFSPADPHDGDKSQNVPAGTVVDSQICSPHHFDFYLQSQAGLQGTSRPAHYHVVHDENSLSPDQVQNICFGLCFTFARCTRSVSVPAPIYYANLVAERAGFHLRDGGDDTQKVQVDEALASRMYFV